MRLSLVLAAVLALSMAGSADAQRPDTTIRVPDSSEVQVLHTKDGTRFVGRTLEVRSDSLLFESRAGVVRVARANIATFETIPRERMHGGDVWFPNPNTTRLLFAPTGRMLPRGQSYLNNTYLFFLGYAGGVTDRLTLGGGFSVFPLDDFSDNIFYITPKVGLYQSDKLNVAVGALVGWAGGEEGDYGGIAYGVSTFGPPDKSLTIGGGYGFAGGELANDPVFMAGTSIRMSRRIGFISENYLVVGEDPAISYGLRFMGERMTFDLAFVNVLGEDIIFPGIPFVDFAFFF